ncbi:MAG: plasmid stability protein [Rhodothermales bacterium]|jgi:plasmid stability protein
MRDFALRGLSDELHARLKAQAEENGRSLNAEILQVLEGEFLAVRRVAEREARVDAWREKYLPEGGFDLDDIIATIRSHRDGR